MLYYSLTVFYYPHPAAFKVGQVGDAGSHPALGFGKFVNMTMP